MDKLLARQGEVQDRIDAVGGWELEHKLELAMDALRCPTEDSPVEPLSGGERRRVEYPGTVGRDKMSQVCRALAIATGCESAMAGRYRAL